MKPTKEQEKKFWEHFGFIYSDDWSSKIPYKNPQGDIVNDLPVDLNNLFKYAVPKLKDGIDVAFSKYEDTRWFVKLENQVMTTENEDPALALFWAIWKVIKD